MFSMEPMKIRTRKTGSLLNTLRTREEVIRLNISTQPNYWFTVVDSGPALNWNGTIFWCLLRENSSDTDSWTISVRRSFLYVRIYDGRQIPTYKDDTCTDRIKIFLKAVDP